VDLSPLVQVAALGPDMEGLVKAVGFIGVLLIVFAESGLLVGFFLPGDSLLFTAGFLASQDLLSIWPLSVGCFLAAVAGDSFGYWCGKRYGPRVFRRRESFLFDPKHLARSNAFYARHGGKTIVIARFVPIVRTFAPILAGVGVMPYRRFVAYNVVGGALWAFGLTWLGYWLGSEIPGIDRYLLPVIALIVLVSVAPTLIHLLKTREDRRRAIAAVRGLRARRRAGGGGSDGAAILPRGREEGGA
jgi:membrane-associated protein